MKLLPLLRRLVLSLGMAAAALPASAAFYIGDTTDGPTFDRPFADFSGISGIGTDVSYEVFAFQVTVAGDYIVRSFAEGLRQGQPWDQFIFLYEGSFDPTQPLINGVIANDDFNGTIGRSGFDIALATNTAYYLVTTGFESSEQGRYLNIIRGPGAIVPVPEPETYALLALGLGAVVLAVRRRRGEEL
ncbi:MAG: hypothetical protein Fur0014_12880 [Rubrivivax sp.]